MPAPPGSTYAYDALEHCPVCKQQTPHNTGLIGGGKVCLVCGVMRQHPEGRFRKCTGCDEWVPAKEVLTNVGQGLVPIPFPDHKCK